MSAPIRSRWGFRVAAMAILVLATLVGAFDPLTRFVDRWRARRELAQLIRSLDRDQLPQSRFTALGVTGTRGVTRGAHHNDLRLDADTLRIVDLLSASSSPDAIATTAATLAVKGDTAGRQQAVALLESAVQRTPNDARLWSDLAGARLEVDDGLQALVAADQALRIDPHLPSAAYNRGLALERIGLTTVGADAWRACLDLSPDAELATLVRRRLQGVVSGSENDRWKAVQPTFFAAVANGDTAAVDRLTTEFPRAVRAYSEMIYLYNWANAFSTADAVNAETSLQIARAAGSALRKRGDTVVAEAAKAIDEAIAHHDENRLRKLVKGHQAFYRGRMAYAARENVAAERELRAALAAFSGTGSSMVAVATQWAASPLIDAGRIDEAHTMLTTLLASERSIPGHRSIIANSEYLMSLCEAFRGRWNESIAAAHRSTALFHEGGETSLAAISENEIADVLDLIGQPELGWENRLIAFRSTSETGFLDRVLTSVGGGTRAAMRAQNRDLALSLLDVELTLGAQVKDRSALTDALTRRVILQHERGDFGDRDIALGRARNSVSAVDDPRERAKLMIELDAAEAITLRDTNPRRAIDLLTGTVNFCADKDRRIYLPEVFLNRGRMQLTTGDMEAAWRDFSAGMTEIESQRSRIDDMQLRSRVFDASQDLFAEATALQVRRGDADAAFRVAERARGRELLDVVDKPPIATVAELAQHLDRDTALIEYVVLPEQLVIFTVRNGALRMRTVNVKASELTLERKDLYALILKPVEEDIATAGKLIIVPDKILQRVPFNRYLINTHVVAIAPSASVLAANKRREMPKDRSVLIVGSPAPDPDENLEALPAIEDEVETLGRIYRPARTLFGPDATKSRFIAEAPNYDTIHFSGHGLSDEESLTASLLFAKRGNDSGRMYMSDIAKLRLPRAPLVVLAACGTLRGKAAGVEGMPSLARSFLAAGASTVVGTLWDIDDAKAAPLLESFHRHIVEGDSPAAALRSAQLEAIARGGDDAKPKNWAAFVVYTATP